MVMSELIHTAKKIRTASLLVLVCCATTMAQKPISTQKTRDANLKEYVELLRRDLKKDKVAILTQMMQLEPSEAAGFWPVYNEYDKSLTKLGDEKVALIRMYAENYGSLSDQKVTEIAMGLLDVEGKRNQLKKEYFQKISQALSPKIAARFLQIESQLEKLVDLQIASSLPIVE